MIDHYKIDNLLQCAGRITDCNCENLKVVWWTDGHKYFLSAELTCTDLRMRCTALRGSEIFKFFFGTYFLNKVN